MAANMIDQRSSSLLYGKVLKISRRKRISKDKWANEHACLSKAEIQIRAIIWEMFIHTSNQTQIKITTENTSVH